MADVVLDSCRTIKGVPERPVQKPMVSLFLGARYECDEHLPGVKPGSSQILEAPIDAGIC